MCTARHGAALLLSLALSACDTGAPEQLPAPSVSPTQQARDEALQQRLQMPSPGTRIIFRDGLVSVTAADVPQLALLAQLAKQAGFGLDLFHRDWSSVTLSFNEVPVETALGYILGKIPYEVSYLTNSQNESPVIERIRVGEASTEGEYRAKALAALNTKHLNAKPPLDVDVSMDQLLALSDQEKIEILAHLSPSANNLPLLLDFLKNNRDTEIRISAMAALENADSPQALDAIVEVLKDSDPQMVLAAIDSIEFAGGVEQIFALEALSQHPSPTVRKAADEAIEFLR